MEVLGGLLILTSPIWIIILISIRQVNEYERGVKFRLGKYKKMVDPGWRLVFPVIEQMRKVDMRTKTVDVPYQETITKDNVSARVNAILYYKVADASKAVLVVENFFVATSHLAQTTMRNVIGEVALDDLLAKREEISDKIKKIIDEMTDPWGIDVENVELSDIILPDEMKRMMASQAEAEREKRAVIIKAEGEVIASKNISKAAKEISSVTGGMHLRTLQTLYDISGDPASKLIFLTPVDALEALKGYGGTKEKK